MWPLGHAAAGYILYTLSTYSRFGRGPGDIPTLLVLFGTQFPDLIDKPGSWYFGVLPTGRSFAHSLLLLVPLSVLLYLLARRYRRGEYGIAFAIGALSHALFDVAPALWTDGLSVNFLLWPVLPVQPYESGPPSVIGLLRTSLGETYFLLEIVFAITALYLWHRDGHPGVPLIAQITSRLRGPLMLNR